MAKPKEPNRTVGRKKAGKGQRIGYLRVSTLDQNEVRQLEGLDLDKTFTDKASGKDAKRPQLEHLLGTVQEREIYVRLGHRATLPVAKESYR
jgi:predicted site-specific integrase-resolvase